MKNIILLLSFCGTSILSFAQGTGEIKGTVKDAASGETIIGATILIAEGKGAVTDIDGNYSLKADPGTYTLNVSFVGYEGIQQKVKIEDKVITLNFSLQLKTLNEVEIVADIAKTRETPVAFSTISSKQLQEELHSRDLAMIVNTTPGAYATETGGGSGDARVTIRGFDQRNVAVLVDGVPVNDMESGQVYWSNWDGLGDVTRNVQIQRGLGASKLAIASVGGTMNIITKGIDSKREISIKQEVMSDLMYKTGLSFNSGQLKGGWGITGAFTRKKGVGFADYTWTDAYSYFLKVQKRMGKHLLSLSAAGAPQRHGQRSDRLPIVVYDSKLASSVGVNSDSMLKATPYTYSGSGDRGIRYNPHGGQLNGNDFNERINYFHKPQINLSHFWNVSEKLYWSTVAYASFGNGGGVRLQNTPNSLERDRETGQIIFDEIFKKNAKNKNATYSATEFSSTNILKSQVNNHQWYGFLSSLSYKIDSSFSAIIGIDGRYYKGIHYDMVYDLLGGDYYLNSSDANQPAGTFPKDPRLQSAMKRKGDKIFRNYEGYVTWGGAFGQLEYKRKKLTAFVTGSISETGYQRKDYFRKKDLVIDGEVVEQAVGYGETYFTNGSDYILAKNGSIVTTSGDTTFVDNLPIGGALLSIVNAKSYTSESGEARTSITKKKWYLGFTTKGGANYNINSHHNVYVNVGYLQMAPKFNLVFTTTNEENTRVKMQKVVALEGGYGIKYSRFASNLNVYYTNWQNKPLSEFPTIRIVGDDYYYNTSGLNAIHKGIELDFIYKLLKNLDVEGIVSLGDWTTNTADQVTLYDINTDLPEKTIDFSAKGIHVGDAAQTQLGGSLRYEIIKNLYVKARYTYFTKNYSNFNLLELDVDYNLNGTIKQDNRDRESWKMPAYGLLDLNAGYEFKLWKLNFTASVGVMNVLNTTYISDAQNGVNFDATTTLVHIGPGTRFNTALRIAF
ncbi:MAG TPA: TonB-dependent receptor [Bacteroidia bacterium]